MAPDDIEPDVAAIRDSMQKQIDRMPDSAKDPLGGVLGGILAGLTTMGSWERVGNYVTDHCDGA